MRKEALIYILDKGEKIKNCTTCLHAGSYFQNVVLIGDVCGPNGIIPLSDHVCDLYDPHIGKIKYFIKQNSRKRQNKNLGDINFRGGMR